MGYVPNELLSRLTGRNLNSVVFLKWYLQLTFDGPYLNCDVWPKVNVGAGEIEFGQPGYRDAICSLLACPVLATHEETGVGLVLEFEAGTLRIHPTREELDGPEIALLAGFDDRAWMCWRPGEDSFEDLA
jgi:hypothetical protein